MSKLLGFALVQNQDGDVELFASQDEEESPGALWRRSDKPNEQDWTSLGPDTGVLSGPTVAPNSDERLEAFIVGKDYAIWHAWQDGPGGNWSGWHSLEAPPGQRATGEPVLARNEDGRLELFVVTDDRIVWHRWQEGAARGPWAAWHSLGGEVVGFDELA